MNKVPCCALITAILPIVLLALDAGCVFAQTLREGEWRGTFLTYDGIRYKIKYDVKYDRDAKEEPLMINMINLDMEPLSEFTYKLENILIDKEKMKFTIRKEFETKECILNKEGVGYVGTCKSSVSDSAEVSEITMHPAMNDDGEEYPHQQD